MRFAIIAERRYLRQRMPRALLPAISRAGHRAVIICSDDEVWDFPSRLPTFDTYDAVISRDRSLVGLVLLTCAERSGVPAVNSRAAIEGVRNKAEMAATLAAAGIPMPQTIVCRSLDQLTKFPDSYFPLVLKPNFGDNGNGLQIVSAKDITRIRPRDRSLVLAQKLVPNDGFDVKLYVAGKQVWAVRKPNVWCIDNNRVPVHIPLTQEMRALALRCGRAVGLEVYGVDALPGPQGMLVLEVNEFPNFSDIAEAPQALADVLIAAAGRHRAHGAGAPEKVA
jgi:ribosomal protein S6--L-glutamate ligase